MNWFMAGFFVERCNGFCMDAGVGMEIAERFTNLSQRVWSEILLSV